MTKQKIISTIAVVLMFSLNSFAEEPKTETKETSKVESTSETKSEKKSNKKDDKKSNQKAGKKMSGTVAVFKTSMGTFKVKLFKDRAPKTVENFVGLATGSKEWTHPATNEKMKGKSLYAGTVFHRIIKDFMIQGGDPLGKGIGGPGYRFEDEVSRNDKFDKPGILAMANAGPNTNGSQFFVTLVPTPWLNGKHTIFGEVTEGMDIVNKIGVAPTGAMDRPKTEITVESITIE